MSRKTLNAANLAALGPDRLAALLMEVSTGSAAIKRRLRLELIHNVGPLELAHEVRKRIASIRRAKSHVGWRKRRALVADLKTQARMITEKIAPDAPGEAMTLAWEFMGLGASVLARVEDSRGEVGAVFAGVLGALGAIAAQAQAEPRALAATLWEALHEDRDGLFDAGIPQLAPALGDAGLAHLKTLIEAYADLPPERRAGHAAQHRAQQVRHWLQQIATAQNDTNAYLAQFTQGELARPQTAAQAAGLLLDAGRAEEALALLERATDGARPAAWDAANIACLLALGRGPEAQAHRWACFTETLAPQMLRDHLAALPDFEDIEAEDAAKTLALAHPDLAAALRFFLAWPDLHGAARLVEERRAQIDGRDKALLGAAAERLRARHPRAAVLLWRRIIEQTLFDGRSAAYPAAADHLMDCAAADLEITDYGPLMPHGPYLEALRQRYARKAAFWARLP